MSKSKPFFAVAKPYSFGILVTTGGVRIKFSKGDPTHYIPLFPSRKAAEKWHGSKENIIEIHQSDA